jgi:3-methyladenine DNA glycosylase AlkD
MVDPEVFRALLLPHADLERGRGMSAYMKNQFEFLGIPKPKRFELTRELRKSAKSWDAAQLRETVDVLWAQNEREFLYIALELLHETKLLQASDLTWLKGLILTKSWWDSVDTLAPHPLGKLVQKFPELGEEVESWGAAPNFWLRRSAILHQLGYKNRTDEARLFRLCLQNAEEKEFFIRKGMGWALRQYARTNPEGVKQFVETNADRFAPLTRREALKHLS